MAKPGAMLLQAIYETDKPATASAARSVSLPSGCGPPRFAVTACSACSVQDRSMRAGTTLTLRSARCSVW